MTLERSNKSNKSEIIKNLAFLLAILLNLILAPNLPAGCDFDSTLYNKKFLFFVLLPDLSLRLIVAQFFSTQGRWLRRREFILALFAPCLAAGWWVYTLTQMDKLSQHCYEPYPSYGLLVYFALLVMIIPAAFLVLCALSLLVFCCPCITFLVVGNIMERREQAQLKDRVIEALPKVAFDPAKFREKTCVICMYDFETQEEITPLSCDIRHYFHTHCIKDWMRLKNQCPLCKKEISV